eukprot:scaffold53960_cov63-Phaeocystis_antarctica.AAC.4
MECLPTAQPGNATAPPFAQVLEDGRQRVVAAARLVVACLIELGLATVVLAAVRVFAARPAGSGGLAHAHLAAVLERALRRVRCAQNLDGTARKG